MSDDETIADAETAGAAQTPPPVEPPVEVAESADDSDDDASSESPTVAAPAEAASPKKWYVIKVQSGREESIKAAIERKVKIEGLEEFFGQVVIPVERVTEVKKTKETKNGEKVTKEKRVVKEKKKFPGYLMAEVEFNDQVLYLFRETGGVGDFVGAAPGKPPVPMSDRDVAVMLGSMLPEKDRGKIAPTKTKIKLDFEKGDKVRIREGAFANMEGEVKEISEPKEASDTPKVSVEVSIFGRPVPVELDYWQVDKA
ncbi:MAG TPA: transcription termination/antitermination protein NusG [Fimbriiglobus sp.]|jgi:transcriptional antiterminator NusG